MEFQKNVFDSLETDALEKSLIQFVLPFFRKTTAKRACKESTPREESSMTLFVLTLNSAPFSPFHPRLSACLHACALDCAFACVRACLRVCMRARLTACAKLRVRLFGAWDVAYMHA